MAGLRGAIFGTGLAAAQHALAMRGCGVEIALAVGRTEEGARRFAGRWGVPRSGRDPALLLEPGIDCVHICAPPALHYPVAKALLEAGKNIICEKPLCIRASEAGELARLASSKGLVCAVGFNLRFHPACQAARAAAMEPGFGPVRMVHGTYLQEYGALPARLDWRYDSSLAGELHAVSEIGSHWLDLAQHISGEKVAAVCAMFDGFHPVRYVAGGMMHGEPGPGREALPVASEDAAVVALRFAGGAIGAVTLSELSPGRLNRLSLEVTGENGNLWWDSEDAQRLFTARKGEPPRTAMFPFGAGYAGTFQALAAEVYRAIATGGPAAYPTFAEGAQVVRVCEAILRSARGGSRWVEVPGEGTPDAD